MSKGRSKNRSTRAALPKGLPHKKSGTAKQGTNPFERTKNRGGGGGRVKHDVLNRTFQGKDNTSTTSALARSLQRRNAVLREGLKARNKANSFVDRRIGTNDDTNEEDRTLARIVRERVSRSKKNAKFDLGDDNNDSGELTHRGAAINADSYTGKEDHDAIILSDDEDDEGNYFKQRGELDRADTEMHFGGGRANNKSSANPYGADTGTTSLGDVYRSRKEEMDDMIKRQKIYKAERQKLKEKQVDRFEQLDDSFQDLAKLLTFRDKRQEYREERRKKEAGEQTEVEKEMDAWERDVKTFQFDRKVAATDRTKTPEEIAKEENERLHKAETRRLARMNGDFEGDDLSDVDEDEDAKNKMKKKRRKGDDELDDEEEEQDKSEVQFTSEGIVTLDKFGNVVEEEEQDDSSTSSNSEDEEESVASGADEQEEEDDTFALRAPLKKGDRVRGLYHAKEQYDDQGEWYNGVVSEVRTITTAGGNTAVHYDLTYDDGDFEDGVERKHIKLVVDDKKKAEALRKEEEAKTVVKKRKRARQIARSSIPFVFEVPTTLEALHDVIGTHATIGSDATLILQRIHASNSVRLNKNNLAKMQNFYDVLLRRFIMVGDAVHASGDDADVGRYAQLDALTTILYTMAQDCPDMAGAVWGRRLGVLQRALAKRLRDGEGTAWPSIGTILLLRVVGHVFPVTDLRHPVVTPTMLLLGQMLAQCPLRSLDDLRAGLLCAGLMLEYSKEAKRVAPEAMYFLASIVRLFGPSSQNSTDLGNLRESVMELDSGDDNMPLPQLSLEKECDESLLPVSIFCSALHLIESCAETYDNALNTAESESFAHITQSLARLKPKRKKGKSFPASLLALVLTVSNRVAQTCSSNSDRMPLRRRARGKAGDYAIQSLAPKMQDPTRAYYMAKEGNKNKTQMQLELDRNRREYKKEYKAVSREIRLDAAFIEGERRKEKDTKDRTAKEKRHKNHAWLEQEQATMNQQVRMGGGLLKGGGTGAARVKAKSAQLGIKKGGKFRS